MFSSLSTLLVQDQIVSFIQMDEVLRCTNEVGGTLDTALLEKTEIDEAKLLTYLGLILNRSTLPSEFFVGIELAVTGLISAEDANELKILPVYFQNNVLVVAVTEPLTIDILDALVARTGGKIEEKITLELRLKEAHSEYYGIPLTRRYQKLCRQRPSPLYRAQIKAARPKPVKTPKYDPLSDMPPGSDWSAAELAAFYQNCHKRDQILLATLGFSGRFFRRRMLFVVGKTSIRGFAHQGISEIARNFRTLTVHYQKTDSLYGVCHNSQYFFGSPQDVGFQQVYQHLGGNLPQECMVFPISVGVRAALLIVGDNVEEHINPSIAPLMLVIVRPLAEKIKALIRSRKTGSVATPTTILEQKALDTQHTAKLIDALKEVDTEAEHGLKKIPTSGWDLPDLDSFALGLGTGTHVEKKSSTRITPLIKEKTFRADKAITTFEKRKNSSSVNSHPLRKKSSSIIDFNLDELGSISNLNLSDLGNQRELINEEESLKSLVTSSVQDDFSEFSLHDLDSLNGSNWELESTNNDLYDDLNLDLTSEADAEEQTPNKKNNVADVLLNMAREAGWEQLEGESENDLTESKTQHYDALLNPDPVLPAKETQNSNSELERDINLDSFWQKRVSEDEISLHKSDPEEDPESDHLSEEEEEERKRLNRSEFGYSITGSFFDTSIEDLPSISIDISMFEVEDSLSTQKTASERAKIARDVVRQKLDEELDEELESIFQSDVVDISIVEFVEENKTSEEQKESVDEEVVFAASTKTWETDYSEHLEQIPKQEDEKKTNDQLLDMLCEEDVLQQKLARSQLLKREKKVFSAIAARFPGKVHFDFHAPETIQRSIISQGSLIAFMYGSLEHFASVLILLLESPDPKARFYAALLLSRFKLNAVIITATECVFDDEPQVRLLAIRILESNRGSKGFKQALTRIRARMHNPNLIQCELSIIACAALKDEKAIPTLILFLGHDDHVLRARARISLTKLTFQEFGENKRKWEKWNSKFGKERREQWFLDAMLCKNRAVRFNAFLELRQIPNLVVNYNPDMDKEAMIIAQRKVAFFFSSNGGAFSIQE